MHCRTCDYSLWNLKPGPCPECGTAFAPTQFRFRPNAVQFLCPHCRQQYYGTTATGHLEPASFRCPTCNTDVTMDEMLVLPAPNVEEDETSLPPLPWEERRRHGLWRSWWQTVVRSLTAPGEAMQGVPATSPLSGPVGFAAFTLGLGAAGTAILVAAGTAIGAVFRGRSGSTATSLVIAQVGVQAANVLFVIVATLIAGFVAHLALMALRGAHGGLNRTMQATLYSSGAAYALSVIPCPCFSIASLPWWIVCMTAMYRVAHSTTTRRSLVATLVAAVVSIAIAASLATIPAWMGFGSSTFGISVSTTSSTATTSTLEDLGEALMEARTRDAAWCTSPLELVADGTLSGADLAKVLASDGRDTVKLGLLQADDLRESRLEAIEAEAARIAPLLPADGAPYRIGRAIFCYGGVSPQETGAWLAIVEPRRNENGVAKNATWNVIMASGTVRLSSDEIMSNLAEENERRVARGQSAIPDPAMLPDALTGVVPRPIISPPAPTERKAS